MTMQTSSASEHLGKTLSLLWLFAILNILFRDIHEMSTASAVSEILSGYVSGRPVTEEALLIGGLAVELLLLAFLLSALLPPSTAKRINLAFAPLAIIGVLYGAPSDLDDYFFAAVEITTFAAITVMAWRWRTDASEADIHEVRRAA